MMTLPQPAIDDAMMAGALTYSLATNPRFDVDIPIHLASAVLSVASITTLALFAVALSHARRKPRPPDAP